MKIEIRNDTAEISGYVNAVGRDSRPIPDVRGKFVEQIEPGAFRAALERAEDVKLLLNHDKSKEYASVKGGNLTLIEDSIGLRAHAVITDAELIGKARNGELRGWSFGMYVNDAEMEERAEGIPRRHVKGLDIFEVSLIDRAKMPCYAGTSVECRSDDGEQLAELRSGADEEPEISEERSEPVDYSAVDDMIAEVRYGAVDNMLAEVRFNPYHDPSNGRFTSGGGGGGGGYIFMVPKGRAKHGILLKDIGLDDNAAASEYYHSVYNASNVNNGRHNLVNGNNANTNATASGQGEKFGVSGGAGTAYTIVKTTDGNKLIRNDYLLESADGRVLISTKSLAAAKPVATSGIDYSKSPHSAMPDTVSGVTAGKAMTFEEADNGRANPNYSPFSYGYSHNCQSTVVTHEARMRGYDLETRPKTSAAARELSHDTTLAWIDPNTGRKPSMDALTGNKGVELSRVIQNGERYSIEFHHSTGGHIITASKDSNGVVRLYDPQTNMKASGTAEINKYFSDRKARNIRYLRVDNLDFNEDMINAITKPTKKS